jgi:flagellar biogenesis protein FliO
MNALFGLELPTPVNFVIAFVVVLGLIGAATWLVRRFGATRLEAGARNRQPRLAVLDSAAVDGRRKLVIIRRDNVEHLLMIGGPTDVVVETNIVRSAAAAAREAPAVRVNGGELPRAIPLPDTTATWPLQPEPAIAAPAAPVRAERIHSEDAAPPAPAAEPAPERAQPAEPAAVAAPPPPRPVPAPRPVPKQAPPVQVDAKTAAATAATAANDANLASMAHQLEAALRRPGESAKPASAPAPAPKRIEPRLAPVPAAQPAPRPAPKPAAAPVAAAAAAAPAAANQSQPFESLEQEMASLLGRPGKS